MTEIVEEHAAFVEAGEKDRQPAELRAVRVDISYARPWSGAHQWPRLGDSVVMVTSAGPIRCKDVLREVETSLHELGVDAE